MYIGYPRAPITSVSLAGVGGEFVNTPDGSATLIDGDPQSVARLQWPALSEHQATDYVEIQLQWSTGAAVPLRVGQLIARGLPAGLKVELRGKRPADPGYTYALGGNALTAVVTAMPDGSTRASWIVADALQAVHGAAVRLYNDVGGATVFDSLDLLDLLELEVQPAVEVRVATGSPEWSMTDPSVMRDTLGSGLDIVQRTPYRSLQISLAPVDQDAAYRGGLANAMDLQRLDYALCRGARSIVVLTDTDAAGDYDELTAIRNTAYGVATLLGPMSHIVRRHWSKTLAFRELPT